MAISKLKESIKRSMAQNPLDTETNVLIVEDELVLRMRAVDIVEDAGFTPVEAINADQAIAILEARSDISVLFTDIQMPGSMDGLRLARAVHDKWPSIKIILVSGQIVPPIGDRPADSRFFGKPLETAKMVSELQDMVGKGALQILQTPSRISAHSDHDLLVAENDSLRLLLEQAAVDAQALLTQAGIDAKEQEAARNLQTLIHGELHHRIKNTFATVSAIASQSLRNAASLEHAKQAVDGRLAALGRAHDLLMQGSWANASLSETVQRAIEPYSSERFSITGPEISINSGAVIALAMTFNELCTNATKFGALSVPTGLVELTWTVSEANRFTLLWCEKSGAKVEKPTRRSFGTRMIQSLGQQLSGDVRLAYEPTGFIYTLDVPLQSLAPAH